MTRMRWIALAAALCSVSCGAQNSPTSDVPVAPIAATAFEGWTNAFELKNEALQVVVVPAIGRIARIAFRGEDFLRLDPGLKGQTPGTDANAPWMNYGGDWLWPVPQSLWTHLAPSDWPPAPILADRPWSGTAWTEADGSQSCLISRDYGAPLNIRVSRLIKLDPGAAHLSIRQTIQREGDSSVPVALWNITQIAGASSVVLPSDAQDGRNRDYRAMMFGEPPADRLAPCPAAVVYSTGGGEHKLCSESGRGWIAAAKNGALIVERATAGGTEGARPDGGCAAEMYSNAGLGYTEIETLSVQRNLKPGESLQNILTIECAAAPAGPDPCALAEAARRLAGETGDSD